MKYASILKSTRNRTTTVSGRGIVTESESDRGRVLFCPAFRRLQQKAQVFSMEPNAAVRSRLTHSLEVSQVGRYIADQIGLRLQREDSATPEECMALVTFVETACLMHDIGNPPFGHFGEAAIQKWFGEKGEEKLWNALGGSSIGSKEENKDRIADALADFREFDGNPQGLRVVAKLQWNTDHHGLNLTKTTIASYLKYLRKAGDDKIDGAKFVKKAGYFGTEAPLVRDVWAEFGYKLDKPQRFPLAYIMEAADDIAYCISDLEDSVEKDLLDQKIALGEIATAWEQARKAELKSGSNPEAPEYQAISDVLVKAANGSDGNGNDFTYTDFRTSLNRILVDYAVARYVDKQQEVFSGDLDSLLPADSGPGKILDALKNYCRKKVYCHDSVQRVELAGYTAISGLLDHFGVLLDCSSERFSSSLDYQNNHDANHIPIIIEKKLLALFPKKYIFAYNHAVKGLGQSGTPEHGFGEWNLRAHLIVDFVSGMTDDYAMATYRVLQGISF